MKWLKNIITRLIRTVKFFRNKDLSCYDIDVLDSLINSLINDVYNSKEGIVIKSRYTKILFRNPTSTPEEIEKILGLNKSNRYKQRIVAAATKLPDGTIIVSVRHTDKYYHEMLEKLYPGSKYDEVVRGNEIQGFVDNKFNFLTREEAVEVALDANQVIYKTPPSYELFSEDIY